MAEVEERVVRTSIPVARGETFYRLELEGTVRGGKPVIFSMKVPDDMPAVGTGKLYPRELDQAREAILAAYRQATAVH
jgi:hypothetical protein